MTCFFVDSNALPVVKLTLTGRSTSAGSSLSPCHYRRHLNWWWNYALVHNACVFVRNAYSCSLIHVNLQWCAYVFPLSLSLSLSRTHTLYILCIKFGRFCVDEQRFAKKTLSLSQLCVRTNVHTCERIQMLARTHTRVRPRALYCLCMWVHYVGQTSQNRLV